MTRAERPAHDARTTAVRAPTTCKSMIIIYKCQVISLEGKRTGILGSKDNLRVNKDEKGQRKMFLYPSVLSEVLSLN